jgi:ADP-heptose:LPS heptosyltransferase
MKTTRCDAPLSRPSTALIKVDRLREGAIPKILVVRSRGGIGDVLMTTPTVRAISDKYKCKVDYCTDFAYLDGALPKVLRGVPYIGEVFPHDQLDSRKEEYDAVVNLTCPCTVHEQPLAKPINRIDLFARHASVKLQDTSMDYVLDSKELEWAKEYLTKYNLMRRQLVMVQPSSSHTQRDAPVDKMVQAMNDLAAVEKNVVFLIITHDSDNLRSAWDMRHVHILHDFDVRQLSALMHYCDLVLCPDSAVLHMASAQSKRTVTLFGPTDPRARVNYHPEAVAIWPAKHLKNYPVWYQKPKDGFLCWKLLEPQIIADVSRALLKKLPLPKYNDLVTYGQYHYESTNYEIL